MQMQWFWYQKLTFLFLGFSLRFHIGHFLPEQIITTLIVNLTNYTSVLEGRN